MNAHPAHRQATTNIGGHYYTRAGRRVVDRKARLWGWATSKGNAIFVLRPDLGTYVAIWKSGDSSRLFTMAELGMAESHFRALRSVDEQAACSSIS